MPSPDPVAPFFLEISGFRLRVFSRTAQAQLARAGVRARSYAGQDRDGRRDERVRIDGVTPTLDKLDGDALAHLLRGEGHHIAFDHGLEASTGLRPTDGYSAILRPDGGVFRGAVRVEASTTLDYVLGFVPARWTILARVNDGVTGRFDAMALRSDGFQWINGTKAPTAGVGNVLGVVGNTAKFAGTNRNAANVNVDFDEGIVLPWLASDEMIVAWQALREPFSPLPLLRVTGRALEDAPFGVLARATFGGSDVRMASLADGLGFRANAEGVTFSLRETRREALAQDVPLPISFWPFDAVTRTGAVYADIMAANNNATVAAGTVTSDASQVAEGATFADLASRIEVPHAASLAITGDLTLGGWVRFDSGGAAADDLLVTKETAAGVTGALRPIPYRIGLDASRRPFFEHKSSGATSPERFTATDALVVGKLHHVAVVRRAGTVGIFVDGLLQPAGFVTAAQTPADSGELVRFNGAKSGVLNSNFRGQLDEWAIWNVALTREQLRATYTLGSRGYRLRAV